MPAAGTWAAGMSREATREATRGSPNRSVLKAAGAPGGSPESFKRRASFDPGIPQEDSRLSRQESESTRASEDDSAHSGESSCAPSVTDTGTRAAGFLSRIINRTRSRSPTRKATRKKTRKMKDSIAGVQDYANVAHNNGSLRFPGSRRAPAKWAKCEPTKQGPDIIDHMQLLWHVRPPTVLLSAIGLTPPAHIDSGVDLVEQAHRTLRRGLKRAALKTNAWIVTAGTATASSPAPWIGQAVGNSEVVTIGFAAWESVAEREQLQWSRTHLYGNYRQSERQATQMLPSLTGGERKSNTQELPPRKTAAGQTSAVSESFSCGQGGYGRSSSCGVLHRVNTQSFGARNPTTSWKANQQSRQPNLSTGEAPLDRRHSHFFLVSGEDQSQKAYGEHSGGAQLRNRFERAVHATDLSNVGVPTPCLTILINGDEQALKTVHARLLADLPVVVLVDTGGAAADLYSWLREGCLEERDEDEEIRPEYEEFCNEYMPQLLAYAANGGSFKGPSENRRGSVGDAPSAASSSSGRRHPLLTFIDLADLDRPQDDAQADMDDSGGVDYALMHAILTCCRTPKEEVLLAVAWGEPALLQAALESNEGSSISTTAHPAALSHARRDPFGVSTALNLALLSGNPTMVAALIENNANPMSVELHRIFVQQRNRYRLRGWSAEYWSSADGDDNKPGGSSMGKRLATRAKRISDPSAPSAATASPITTTTTRRRRGSIMEAVRGDTSALDEFGAWNIFTTWLPRYKWHVEVRREKGLLQPTWDDLLLWAVITNEPRLSSNTSPLWKQCRDPLRVALLAAQLCQRLSVLPTLRSEQRSLRKQADELESWAITMLDSIDESEQALPLLAMLPCIDVGAPLWKMSSIDIAAEEIIFMGHSISCKHFIAHRHCQYLLEEFFSGNYPKSKARVRRDSSFVRIFLQCLIFFIPGTICEVLPTQDVVHEEDIAGDFTTYKKAYDRIYDEDEDAEEEEALRKEANSWQVTRSQQKLDNRRFSLGLFGSHWANEGEDSIHDIYEDLMSKRWRYFFFVPKVKFVMYAVFHILYIGLNCLFVFPNLKAGVKDPAELNLSEVASGVWVKTPPAPPSAPKEALSDYDKSTIKVEEMVFWGWTALLFVAELKELRSSSLEDLRLYMRSTWNKIDQLTMILVLGVMGLRLTCAPALDLLENAEDQSCELSQSHWARNIYAMILLLLFIKLLAYAEIFESVGVHVIIIGEVLKTDVSVFAVIVAIISTGMGTALTLELNTWAETTLDGEPERDFSERPLYMPYWAVIGYFNHFNLPKQSGNAIPTRILVPLLVFFYLVLILILINLMIAAMSETYVRVYEASGLYFLFEKASLIQEFKRKGALPPPLNALSFIAHDVPRLARKLFGYLAKKCGRSSSFGGAPAAQVNGNDEISRDGFRLVPGPSQQQRLQRRMRLMLRRCLKRMNEDQEEKLAIQVTQLHELLQTLRTENRSSFEKMASHQHTTLMMVDRIAGGHNQVTSRQTARQSAWAGGRKATPRDTMGMSFSKGRRDSSPSQQQQRPPPAVLRSSGASEDSSNLSDRRTSSALPKLNVSISQAASELEQRVADAMAEAPSMAMAARGGAPAMAPQMGKRPSRGEGGTPPRERPPAAERTVSGGNGGPSQVGSRPAIGGAPKPAADAEEKGNVTERAERQDEASRDSKARPPPRSAQQRRRPGAGVAPRRKVSLASPSTAPANPLEA